MPAELDDFNRYVSQLAVALGPHGANDNGALSQLIQVGMMEEGTPIEVNRALRRFSKVIITGGVGFHYFAGFTGGPSMFSSGMRRLPLGIKAAPSLANHSFISPTARRRSPLLVRTVLTVKHLHDT